MADGHCLDKSDKLLYLSNRFADFDEALHPDNADMYMASGLYEPLKYLNFKKYKMAYGCHFEKH